MVGTLVVIESYATGGDDDDDGEGELVVGRCSIDHFFPSLSFLPHTLSPRAIE